MEAERKASFGIPLPAHGTDVSDRKLGTALNVDKGSAQTCSRRWLVWYEPGTRKAEKVLILKLDLFLLLYLCLTFFVKYLDQTNITNAYVSGMSRELELHGNQLNWFTTWFNIGVIIGGPIFTTAITVFSPRWILPGCTLIWSLFVLFMYKADGANMLYVLRFFVGFFESGSFPGAYYMIGSWYRKSEIRRRTAMFMFSSTLGSMTSGYIQAGLLSSMNGKGGLSSWRWLFIFDSIISIPVAFLGFCLCPDEPKAPRVWWMSEEERKISIQRLENEGRDSYGHVDRTCLQRILKSWQLYGFVLAWSLMQLTCGTNLPRWMALWLKSLKHNGRSRFSLEEVNALPTVIGCVALAFMIISATVADRLQNSSLMIGVLISIQLFCYIIFAIWPADIGLLFVAYYMCAAYFGVEPLLGGWLNQACGGDRQLRAMSTSLMVSMGYVVETIAQQKEFPVSDAPSFARTGGYIFGSVFVATTFVWCSLILPWLERTFRREARDH